MALQISTVFKGLTIPAAYVRIGRITGNKDMGWDAEMSMYASSEKQGVLDNISLHADYVAKEDPQVTVYNAFKEQFKDTNPIDV